MCIKKTSYAVLILMFLAIASCAPAVPDLNSVAYGNRMTAEAYNNMAAWQEQALTQTAGAPIVHITETAAAIQIQGTQVAMQATAAAETQGAIQTQTAFWWTPTPNGTATLEAGLLAAQLTQVANNTQRDQLQLEREKVLNDFRANAVTYSYVIVVLVLALLLMLLVRRHRYQPVKVDPRGNVIPVIDIQGGTFTDPDRSPNFRGPVSDQLLIRFLMWWMEKKFGIRPMLPEISADRQDAVTYMDQLVDMGTRGLPATASQQKEQRSMVQEQIKIMPQPPVDRFRILQPGTADLEIVEGQVLQALDYDWKEGKAA